MANTRINLIKKSILFFLLSVSLKVKRRTGLYFYLVDFFYVRIIFSSWMPIKLLLDFPNLFEVTKL